MIAKTILSQLGGNKFTAMTGAKYFLDCGNGLSFSLPSRFANKGINKVVVRLNSSDEYDIEFFKIWGVKVNLMEKVDGVQVEQLKEVFRSVTGLDVSL